MDKDEIEKIINRICDTVEVIVLVAAMLYVFRLLH